MKFKTTTFKGYAADASYYINNDSSGLDPAEKIAADAVLAAMRADYGPSAYIVDCGNETFFGRPDYGAQLKGDCIEYTIVYDPIETVAEKREYSFLHSDGEQITGAYWTLKKVFHVFCYLVLQWWQSGAIIKACRMTCKFQRGRIWIKLLQG